MPVSTDWTFGGEARLRPSASRHAFEISSRANLLHGEWPRRGASLGPARSACSPMCPAPARATSEARPATTDPDTAGSPTPPTAARTRTRSTRWRAPPPHAHSSARKDHRAGRRGDSVELGLLFARLGVKVTLIGTRRGRRVPIAASASRREQAARPAFGEHQDRGAKCCRDVLPSRHVTSRSRPRASRSASCPGSSPSRSCRLDADRRCGDGPK